MKFVLRGKIMDENEDSELDFDQICRICLKAHEKMKSVFANDAEKQILEIMPIQLEKTDGLPQQICDDCTSKLHVAYAFKNQIKESDRILRNYVRKKSAKINKKTRSEKHVKEKRKNAEMEVALAKIKASAPAQNNTTCHLCKKSFSCAGQLTRHLKTHTGIRSYVCELCGKAYMESGSLQKHFLAKHSNRKKPFICPRCKRGFDLRTTLARHIRTHTGEKPFGCDVCHKFYPSKSYLNKHKKIHLDARTKSFICEVCSKPFALKDGLKAHLITHSNAKPFQCSICEKTFSKKGLLTSHTKYIHTKEKDFMCQMCGKTFVTKCELNEHIRKHTGEKREARHCCTTCNRKFAYSTHLKVHIRSEHTGERPYVCEFCTKTFLTGQALKIHKRLHTGERPYTCKYCSKKFVTNESLKVHSRTHTGEKPYACTVCDASFSQRTTLKTHLKNHPPL